MYFPAYCHTRIQIPLKHIHFQMLLPIRPSYDFMSKTFKRKSSNIYNPVRKFCELFSFIVVVVFTCWLTDIALIQFCFEYNLADCSNF
jgi:hypothetical protein